MYTMIWCSLLYMYTLNMVFSFVYVHFDVVFSFVYEPFEYSVLFGIYTL